MLNWIGAVLAAYLLTIGALLALAGALAIMSATIALTTNLGWGAMVVFTIAAIIAGARSLRVLQGIFEASSAGGGDLLARGHDAPGREPGAPVRGGAQLVAHGPMVARRPPPTPRYRRHDAQGA